LGKIPGEPEERELLRSLQKDSQRSLRELAEELGLPVSTVHEKVKRLERDGMVKGYHAALDAKKLGFPATGFILVSVSASQSKAAEKIAKLPGVQEAHLISGDWSLLVKAKCASVEELGKLAERISAIPGVSKAATLVVFETVKEEATLDL